MSDVKAIAFFLPQFHPIPENDLWWGKGFTEWVGVTRARPLFPGHHQPRLPADLGFYDLRLPEVREEQAALAALYGVHALCWYYYWFDGRRLLEAPLDAMLRSGRPGLPFCICWANESWTRRWNGAEHELLVAQRHGPGSDRRFIDDVLPILRDPRYLRIAGAPLLLVYRAQLLPDAARTTALWREVARAEGVGDIHLAAVQGFGLGDPRPLGFDSGVEFPPLVDLPPRLDPHALGLDPRFEGRVWDYAEVAARTLAAPTPSYPKFRGVMTAWDNTPRRGLRAHLFHGATPERYERWLSEAAERTRAERAPGERFLFVNAWNEWGEGAYLEPDQRHGHAWLAATARALGHAVPRLDGPRLAEAQQEDRAFVPGLPAALDGAAGGGLLQLDRLGEADPLAPLVLAHGAPASLSGWAVTPPVEPARDGGAAWLVLRSRALAATFNARVRRAERDDVAAHLPHVERRFTERSGFDATLALDAVPPGRYALGLVGAAGERAGVAWAGHDVRVVAARDAANPGRARTSHGTGDNGVRRGAGLVCALDAELAGPVAVGRGQVLRVSGVCWHPRARVRDIDLLLDGEPHAVEHVRLARPDVLWRTDGVDDPDGHAAESGFVGFVAVRRLERARDAEIVLRARLADGGVHESPLGALRLVPHLEAAAGPKPAPDPAGEPAVVVCLATYEPDPRFLAEQLASLRTQTHRRWICLVNDDASSEARFAELRRLVDGDPRFALERNPRRLGFRANFERCLARVPDGVDFVALSDQDDVWYPDKLERSLAAFRPGVELVYCDMHVVAEDGARLADTFWTTHRNNWTDLAALLLVNTVTGAASVFRASLLADALPFPPAGATPFHDHWLACAALARGELAYVDRPLYAYRQHGANALGHPAPRRARLAPALRELAAAARTPAALRRHVRGAVDRAARIFHTDVLRVTQLARTLQLRFPDAAPEHALALERAARFGRSPVELARAAVLQRLRDRPTFGAELRLLRGLLASRALDDYHGLARRRIRRLREADGGAPPALAPP